jgi:hypothetical protein
MKLKTVTIDGKVYAEVQDDKPVFVGDDGKDIAFDAPGTSSTIARLTEESKSYKTRAQTAETALKGFEGISDPAAALKALETMSSLDAKKLIDAGEVEKVKSEISKGFQDQIADRDNRLKAAESTIYELQVGHAFKGSKFLNEKVAVPSHLLQATYGKNFKVEEGKVVPYDAAGNKIFSRARPGEVADFDEGLEIIIGADPYRDHILKGTGNTGGGSQPGAPGGGAKTITRAELAKLSPADQMTKMTKDGFTVTD